MSTTTVDRRTARTARNMIGALLILLVPLLTWVVLDRPSGGHAVQVVDTKPDIREARAEARFPVLVPEGLSSRWRPTSSRVVQDGDKRVVFRIGYVTPANDWAGLVESDKPSLLADELGRGRKPAGSVDVAGTRWTKYPGRRGGERSLVRTDGAATYLVTGTAKLDELQKLAEALR